MSIFVEPFNHVVFPFPIDGRVTYTFSLSLSLSLSLCLPINNDMSWRFVAGIAGKPVNVLARHSSSPVQIFGAIHTERGKLPSHHVLDL